MKQSVTRIVSCCFLLGLWSVVNVAAFLPVVHGATFRSLASPTSIIVHRDHTSSNRKVPLQERQALSAALSLYGGAAPNAQKVQMAMSSNNAFRGKLLIIASKLFVSPFKYLDAFEKVWQATYWPEVVLIATMVQAVPLVRWCFWRWYVSSSRQHNDLDVNKKDEDTRFQAVFGSSKTHKLALVVQQLGLLQATLYVSDVLFVVLKHLDFSFVVKYQAQRVAGSIILACWAAYNASRLKYSYLYKHQSDTTSTGGSTIPRTLNRLGDIFIYACAFFTVVDLLGLEIGFAIKSIFGLGSFGTLALSLASKDLAAEFVGGLMIQTSNFFHEGEAVSLQDGTKGIVMRIGWLHTYIYKQEDNSIVRVPNSQMSHQRISRARREPSKRGHGIF